MEPSIAALSFILLGLVYLPVSKPLTFPFFEYRSEGSPVVNKKEEADAPALGGWVQLDQLG